MKNECRLFALNGEYRTHVFDTQTREEVIAIRSKSSSITPDGSRLATIEYVYQYGRLQECPSKTEARCPCLQHQNLE